MYPDEKHSVNMTIFAFQKDIYFYDFYFTPKNSAPSTGKWVLS